mmetsp:Transcript_16280/g.16000  ORF Transcript_16280/g.16000 Transcript_16280/m.16000 type:complete len:99 (+) Transcript_16280:163-459(+)
MYDYKRLITQDYPKSSKANLPTCSVCLSPLEDPSPIAQTDIRYSSTDREKCIDKTFKGIYCRGPDSSAFHPQCLVQFVLPNKITYGKEGYPDINEYDD